MNEFNPHGEETEALLHARERFTKSQDALFGVGGEAEGEKGVDTHDESKTREALIDFVKTGLSLMKEEEARLDNRVFTATEAMKWKNETRGYKDSGEATADFERAQSVLEGKRGNPDSLTKVMGIFADVRIADARERHKSAIDALPDRRKLWQKIAGFDRNVYNSGRISQLDQTLEREIQQVNFVRDVVQEKASEWGRTPLNVGAGTN